MNKQICHIIGAGEFYGFDAAPKPGDYIIAADGGLRYLAQEGIAADLVIGDFDTLCYIPKHSNVITLSREKDDTDTLAAVREGLKLGFDTFLFYGCTGGRIEHTLANIQTLAYLSQIGKQGFLFDKDSIMTTITNDSRSFLVHRKGFVSVFSLSNQSEGVCLKGFKYELNDAVVESHFPIGVSNEFVGKASEVSVQNGTLLIVFPRKYKEEIWK